MLVDRQRFTPGVAGYKLQLGVGQAGMPGQPGDRLMPERVRRGVDAGFSAYSLTICCTRLVEYLLLRLVWKSQRLFGWAAMCVRSAVANDLPKST